MINQDKKCQFKPSKSSHKSHHSYGNEIYYRSNNDLNHSYNWDQEPIIDWDNRKRYNQYTLKSMNREEIKELIKFTKMPSNTNRANTAKLTKSEEVRPQTSIQRKINVYNI